MLGNQPPASFGLIARQFLYVMSRIQSPLCTYCRRWPCSDHLDSCRLCRCCFQISQFGRDQSLTEQRYLDLVARLTVILGELVAHSSWPWEVGRRTESQSKPQDHRRVSSSSRSSSDCSPLRHPTGHIFQQRVSKSKCFHLVDSMVSLQILNKDQQRPAVKPQNAVGL